MKNQLKYAMTLIGLNLQLDESQNMKVNIAFDISNAKMLFLLKRPEIKETRPFIRKSKAI